MSRNIKKGPFFQKKIIINKEISKPIYINQKNYNILPEYENYIFYIYNGKTFLKLKIIKKMIGHKFGEFINTRKRHIYKKKKKK